MALPSNLARVLLSRADLTRPGPLKDALDSKAPGRGHRRFPPARAGGSPAVMLAMPVI